MGQCQQTGRNNDVNLEFTSFDNDFDSNEYPSWNKVSNVLFDSGFSSPLMCSHNKFILVVANGVNTKCEPFIYQYNLCENKWIKSIKYPKDISIRFPILAFDKTKNVLYIHSTYKTLSVNLNNKQWSNSYKFLPDEISRFLFIDDKLHVFTEKFVTDGGYHGLAQQNTHIFHHILVKNEESNQFIKYVKSKWIMEDMNFQNGLIYIKSKNILLVFGVDGRFRNKPGIINNPKIVEYKLSDNIWKELKITLPRRGMSVYSAVSYQDEYVIMITGIDSDQYDGNQINKILIYDILNENFVEVNDNYFFKCPFNGDCKAVITNYYAHKSLIINVFIARICNKLPPKDIIDLIDKMYYTTEYIHVFHHKFMSPDTKHYSICVENIFSFSILSTSHL